MKKVIILALLITVLAVVFIGGGVCSADESDVYYYTSQNIEMRVTPSPESKVAIYVPATYAFKYVETLENYVKINYNGYEGSRQARLLHIASPSPKNGAANLTNTQSQTI